jgi:lysophospholipid acyltransferase (LPLAT)-like uncharacterized protein
MRLARSWDRMRFPLPFARGVAVMGPPLAATEVAQIEAALTAACDTADAMAGPHPVATAH